LKYKMGTSQISILEIKKFWWESIQ